MNKKLYKLKEKKGLILINNVKYKYLILNIYGLIELCIGNHMFLESLENEISIYRNCNFNIEHFINEEIYFYPQNVLYFFIYKDTYKDNEKDNDNDKDNKIITTNIIATSRLLYKNKLGYINLVYTNESYRNLGICQNNIKKLIDLTKKFISKYELEVRINNNTAIKCYEKNGFNIVKKSDDTHYLMEKIIKSN